jgi:hypothetical protein
MRSKRGYGIVCGQVSILYEKNKKNMEKSTASPEIKNLHNTFKYVRSFNTFSMRELNFIAEIEMNIFMSMHPFGHIMWLSMHPFGHIMWLSMHPFGHIMWLCS